MTLFAMCLAFSFTSCSDDEEKGKETDESLLIGKWALVHMVYEDETETETETEDNYKASDEVDVIEFKKSGACHNYCYIGPDRRIKNKRESSNPQSIIGKEVLSNYITSDSNYDWNDYGDWELSGDNLSLLFYGEGQTTVKVESLTASRLTFTASGIYDDEDGAYRYEMTYQKID